MSAKDEPQKNLYFCIFSGWAFTSSSVVVVRSVDGSNTSAARSVLDVIVIMVKKYVLVLL